MGFYDYGTEGSRYYHTGLNYYLYEALFASLGIILEKHHYSSKMFYFSPEVGLGYDFNLSEKIGIRSQFYYNQIDKSNQIGLLIILFYKVI